jgi:hypothetical protein
VESKPAKEKAVEQQPVAVQATATAPAGEFKPFEKAALPISSDKQSRMSDLLRRYQADQITPEQYHQARAKLLAEP